jgi:carnitine-CoA ligase
MTSGDYIVVGKPRPGWPDAPADMLSSRDLLPLQSVIRWAATDPDRPYALEVDGREMTYGSFYRELRRWCARLAAMGVRREDRVVSMLPTSVDTYLLWLALASLGAIEVAVDPSLRGEFLHHVLRDSSARLFFVRPEQAASVRAAAGPQAQILEVPRRCPYAADDDGIEPPGLPGPSDIALVIYTSGTTGLPKGVKVPWGQVAAYLGRVPGLGEQDAWYCPWPSFHASGRSPIANMAAVGGRVVLRERFSRRSFWADVDHHGCTIATVSSIMPLLLSDPSGPADQAHRARAVLTTGAGRVGLEFGERFGVKLVACYGSTEAGAVMVNYDLGPGTADLAGELRPGYEGKLVDQAGAAVGPDTAGELLVRPPRPDMMTLGYIGWASDLSPYENGWLRTGDVFMRDATGRFRFVDRLHDVIRRFGENISSAALEDAILADDAVEQCAVIPVPSEIAGQEIFLAAVLRPGADLSPPELYERIAVSLPAHMRPAYVAITSALPTTPTGKVRKRAVLEASSELKPWRSPAAAEQRAGTSISSTYPDRQ